MQRRTFIKNTLTTGSILSSMSSLPLFHILTKPNKPDKLGVALVGMGGYATGQLAPALQETEHCYLSAFVTGTPSKEGKYGDMYNIPDSHIYNYDNYEEMADNPDIDIVYVVLPNNMHAEYSIRALNIGKHVTCEKPMAINYSEALSMVEAAKKAGKKLSIGYRLHYEDHHRKLMEIGQKENLGRVLETDNGFAFTLKNKDAWRLDKKMSGGGPLMDIGIYGLQATVYTLGMLPRSVIASDTTKDNSFFESCGVEGSLDIRLKFPTSVKTRIRTSYEDQYAFHKVKTKKSSIQFENAFYYGGISATIDGNTMGIANVNQQARQMDDFALCVKENRPSRVPGEMGMRDNFIMDKIYESAATNAEVSLKGVPDFLDLVK